MIAKEIRKRYEACNGKKNKIRFFAFFCVVKRIWVDNDSKTTYAKDRLERVLYGDRSL
jgi:hypothetical protein